MKFFSAILIIGFLFSCAEQKTAENDNNTNPAQQNINAPNPAQQNVNAPTESTSNSQTATTVEITDANFDQMILKSDKVVLMDFWAPWCKPCLAIAPTMKELASEYAGKLVVGKLDIDKNPAVTQKYGIEAIPMIMIFKKGKLVDKVMGAFPKEEYKKKIDLVLGS